MTEPLEIREVTLIPGQQLTITVDYPLVAWRIYSTTPRWDTGNVAIMPASALGWEGSLQMVPNMRLLVPARGQYLTMKSNATKAITLVIQVT